MTHTYVQLEVPAPFYDFVVQRMIAAGYGHVFDVGVKPEQGKDCGPIDMHGLALTRGPDASGVSMLDVIEKNYKAEHDRLRNALEDTRKDAEDAWRALEEQRQRRLAVEQELEAMADLCRAEPRVEVKYVERKVYNPMPQKLVVRTRYETRRIHHFVERDGFFGRIGDLIDRMFA